MSPEDRIRLLHMVEAAEAARSFIVDRQRGDLDSDRMLLFALVRAVEIVGEAASNVSSATRVAIPGLPWGAIVGMRNRVVHAYFHIDHEVVWQTVQVELPQLLATLKQALAQG